MRTLSLSILTAGIALSAGAAFAAQGPGAPPAGARMGPPAGHSWQGGVAGRPGMGHQNMGHRNMGHQNMGHRVMVRHGGGRMHGGRNFPHRIRRGFVVPSFWFGPQFHINNWQMYGFASPGDDQRWVRYYDDAYLIDRGGRVVDSREGMDWDRYGEEWDMEDGIPAYRGSRDYSPDDEDYAWSERHQQHGGHAGGYGPGYGYGYGGGYGYGAYAYPIVIETITTSGGMTYTEEVIEEVVQVRQRARRARPRCVCAPPPRPARARPAPVRRPPPGERG